MSSDITKSKLPILSAVSAISVALVIGFNLATAKADIASGQEQQQESKKKTAELERESQDQKLRLQRLEDAFATQNDMVKEIRQDVKDLKNKR